MRASERKAAASRLHGRRLFASCVAEYGRFHRNAARRVFSSRSPRQRRHYEATFDDDTRRRVSARILRLYADGLRAQKLFVLLRLEILRRECFPLMHQLFLDEQQLQAINVDGERIRFVAASAPTAADFLDQGPHFYVQRLEAAISSIIEKVRECARD